MKIVSPTRLALGRREPVMALHKDYVYIGACRLRSPSIFNPQIISIVQRPN